MNNYYEKVIAEPEIFKQFAYKELLFIYYDLLKLKFRELLLNIISNPANGELNAYLQTLLTGGSDNLEKIIESNCYYNLTLTDYANLLKGIYPKRPVWSVKDLLPGARNGNPFGPK